MICLVDERISDKCLSALRAEGFYVVKMPPYTKLSSPVASHPDMLAFVHGSNMISSEDYRRENPAVFDEIKAHSKKLNIIFTDDVFSKEYPRDALFNVLTVGDYAFLNENTVSAEVLNYLTECGLRVVHVNQGYPACTALAFAKSALTADKGMKRALAESGFTVTEVSDGSVSLPPYKYGFIGGACGVFLNKIYFLGDLKSHTDAAKIEAAITADGFVPISLSDEPLADLGRIIFID